MSRLIGTKLFLLLAVWLLTGGLAFADSFDLTDELQHALVDRTCALETDLDEVRESLGEVACLTLRGANPAQAGGTVIKPPPCSSLLFVLALMQPLPEVLKTFRM
jgi:hypothetical protein